MKLNFWPTSRRGWLGVGLNLAAIAIMLTFLFYSPTRLSMRVFAAGASAPDFQRPALSAEILQLSAYRGRPVLLNFFSTDCDFSAQVVANINALHTLRPDVVILSINSNGADESTAQIWADQYQPNYPLLLDPGRQVARAYHVFATPFWVLIDARGQITSVRWGEHSGENLARRVNEFLPSLP